MEFASENPENQVSVNQDVAGGDGPQPTAAEGDTQQLSEQLAEARKQAAEYLDNWRRSAAELSNARKRMQREQADYMAAANARLLEKLLPIVDDVDRAFAALPEEIAGNEWVNGFRLIQRKLQQLLESEGVTPISTQGQTFDPSLHYAVSHEEHAGFSEGDIIDEVAKGYRLGDRILRPAMVRVAKES